MKGNPSDYVALTKLTNRSPEGVWSTLANIGERCDKVPKSAFEWLTPDVDVKFEKAEPRRRTLTLGTPSEIEE